MEIDPEAEEDYDSEVDEEESDDNGRKWDEACYVCNKPGKVMCCETCSHVCHLGCTGLKKEP